ncbi:MAG TPA: HAMP domain-containing sensor histidine kinase [Solirubrobacterales bacterium]|nr:HAMP domain-containing sensor histidine kinase [Solirubrobacterales bacterium]HNF84352.1 HAMP domain-containing sensor histidine kinase [Solirubrobacterales bacterium]
MSLRLRLLIGILVLAAAGLLTLDFVSYRALENHLSDRVDDQVQSAALALAPELRKKAGIEDAGFGFPDGSGFGGPQQSVTGASGGQPPFGDFGPGGGPTGNPGGGLPNELPPGTFAQLKSASGKVLATAFFGYGTASVTRPDLGGDIPVGRFGEAPEIVTVGAQGGSGTEFRASAVADQAGRITYVAVPTSDMKETLDQLLLIEAIVTAAVLIALAGLAWWMIGIGLRPLERMSETAGEIAAGDLSRRVEDEDPRTETGRLGISLNKMLHQIEDSVRQREESEARMRQFLADASHELRTPLASIRGYAELYRLGAIPQGAEADRAISRIENESARMGDLVDGLLTLARLGELPEPVRRPVDLAVVAAECTADAKAMSPDREFSLDTAEDVTIRGNEDQIRQLLANLLRNAIDHTPEGTPVETTIASGGRTIEIEVRDHGPGIDEAHADQLFERFWREGESRSRKTGGAGIGLAVVAGIAGVHGGDASAANDPDGGAIFQVRLARDPDSETSQAAPTGV